MPGFSLASQIRRAASIRGSATATVFRGRSRTWADVHEGVRRIAGALAGLGLEHGDRVAVLSSNSPSYFDLYFAIPWAGGVTVPLNTRLSGEELAFWLNDSGARFVLASAEELETVGRIRSAAPGVEKVVAMTDADAAGDAESLSALMAGHGAIDDAGRADEDIAAIFYTGGTTGRSKGVMLSHRAVLASCMSWAHGFDFGEKERTLIVAPLFHLVAGQNTVGTAMLGGTACILERFEEAAVLEAIEAHRLTNASLVPTMLKRLMEHPRFGEHDLSSLKKIGYGAAPIHPELLREVIDAFPGVAIHQVYGQTEAAGALSMLMPEYHRADDAHGKLKSAGRPLIGVELSIRDEAGAVLAPGEVGEVCAFTGTVMSGYRGNEASTGETIREGWLHTGDAGYLDGDGFLYIVDRIKDMIISGGENIYPAEVEAVLGSHPDVAECAVFGLPDAEWGERVHAVVRPREARIPEASALIAFCRERLAAFKCPRNVELRGEPFPLSGANKVLKRQLKAEVLARNG